MTYPSFNAGDVLTASDMNAVGLWLVKSQTVGTGVASVTVTGAFSADYDAYRIVYTGFSGSVAGAALLFTCVTSGGVDNAANWKGNTFYVVTGASAGLNNSNWNNQTWAEVSGVATVSCSTVFDVTAPFLSQRTQTGFQNAEQTYWRTSAAILDNTTSYTAFKLSLNAGTLTGGTIRVYGYRN